MIRINLLPIKELKAAVNRRRELTIGVSVLGAVVVGFLGLYAQQEYRLTKLSEEIAALRGEIQALNAKIKQVGDLQNKIKELRSKQQIIADLNKKKAGPVAVMESLAAATPTQLWLTEFKETGGKLTINGMAADNQTIAEFLRALATYSYFKDVELVEIAQAGQEGRPFKKFAIKSGITYLPAPLPHGAGGAIKAPAKEEKKG